MTRPPARTTDAASRISALAEVPALAETPAVGKTSTLEETRVLEMIVAARRRVGANRSVLVAITGIDASGKGHIAAQLAGALATGGTRVAVLSVDGWLNLPRKRFDKARPAEHFYRHALRLDEMFSQLVLPLRDRRSIDVEAEFAEETATEYRRHRYELDDVDVVLLEGIFLLKRAFQRHHDLSFWIECTFETALERALARKQEGLSDDETREAYRTIYFPAQEIHLARDEPRSAATAVLVSDPRLS